MKRPPRLLWGAFGFPKGETLCCVSSHFPQFFQRSVFFQLFFFFCLSPSCSNKGQRAFGLPSPSPMFSRLYPIARGFPSQRATSSLVPPSTLSRSSLHNPSASAIFSRGTFLRPLSSSFPTLAESDAVKCHRLMALSQTGDISNLKSLSGDFPLFFFFFFFCHPFFSCFPFFFFFFFLRTFGKRWWCQPSQLRQEILSPSCRFFWAS